MTNDPPHEELADDEDELEAPCDGLEGDPVPDDQLELLVLFPEGKDAKLEADWKALFG